MMPSMLPLILFISTFINVSAFSRPLQSRVSLRNGFNPTTTYELRNSHLLASQTTESSRSSLQGGKTLTPKEILQHDFYLSDIFDIQSNTVDDEPLPLYAALRSIIEAIEKILEECSSTAGNSALLRFLDNTTILRIELSVAAVQAVDPLCWLHAQQLSISKIRRKLSSAQKSEDTSLPVIYLNDAEGRVEAAVIGKSPSFSDSWDPFVGKRIWDIVDEEKISEDFGGVNGVNGVKGANGINGEKDGNIKPPMLKEGDLPKGARVYGASRFDWKFYEEKMRNDKEYKRRSKRYDSIGKNIEDDWDGFGGDRGGYWILPVVELRREMLDNSSNRHTNKGSCEFCSKGTRKVTLAVNIQNSSPSSLSVLGNKHRYGWRDAASQTLTILQELTDELSPAAPTTTLPPVLTRSESTGRGRENEDSGYAFERSVTEALKRIHHYDSVTSGNTSNPPAQTANKEESLNGLPIAGNKNKCESLRKVVLARKVDLNLGASLNGLDALMRMKFGGHVGHLFYLATGEDNNELRFNREFIGCTPERLFQVKDRGNERIVTSEALAGTRIRGLTPKADAELLQELLSSEKDMLENEITGNFIMDAFKELEANGWLDKRSPDFFVESSDDENKSHTGRFFVRRLRHLQHICQTFEGRLSKNANIIDVSRSLLEHLHPTPAVCGDSPIDALDFIRQFETKASFDRGYYTGPIGYIGADSADIFVAIRSALITNYNNDFVDEKNAVIERPQSKVSIFAGAGIVKGSTVQGEWTETSHKLGVMSSIFPPSPITLQIASIPNVAWSTAFIEELVRCGVTQFYICPGSRNTPLTAAIYKSTRSNTGVVRAISVHDERGAGFRALGYSRQNGRPAAIVTSSGTAVANLYPSVVESSSDGVPLLVITADRPYENRDNGSNQSVDQVKIFSSTYVRWFRDIPPPSDDVPVSLALSDANHAVTLANQLAGPVHLNIQFRENLAPDQGPIRNDNRIGSVTKFHTLRFTDVPGFARWSQSGSRWQRAFYPDKNVNHSIVEVAELILQSRRGIVVAGNLRLSNNDANEADSLTSIISHFATVAGMPILAGVQSGALRRERPVVPFAEHLLKHPSISKGLRPDFILQLGSPLISTEISKMITNAVIHNVQTSHVLVQRLYPNERADPEFTVTHRVSSDIGNFLKSLTSYIESLGQHESMKCSELTPLLHLGRELQKEMPSIIEETSRAVDSQTVEKTPNDSILTEPEIMSAISDVLSELSSEKLRGSSLFLSNSMPVRDGEFFLYPRQVTENDQTAHMQTNLSGFPLSVNVNRGASGIDGIISTAIGCSDTFTPTTLVCGDVSALHDLNGLYGLTSDLPSLSNAQSKPQSRVPLTTIIVNNGGGAIFSFLPIAKHGQDVGFEEFWGTPTKSISFRKGADAFGLPYRYANSFESFREAYRSSLLSGRPEIIEARVIDRSTNVDIHQRITSTAIQFVTKLVSETSSDECDLSLNSRINLPIKRYTNENITKSSNRSKKLLLIHGWMGDKTEWDFVGAELVKDLPHEWDIISIDLPGHGEAPYILSPIQQMMRTALSLNSVHENADFYSSGKFSIDAMAKAVCESLQNDHGIKSLDAIAGYSLGGRIALAMNRLCSTNTNMNAVEQDNGDKLITKQTRLILLGANPGKLPFDDHTVKTESDNQRVRKDRLLAQSLLSSLYKTYLIPIGSDLSHLSKFVTKWYGNKVLWGDLQGRYPHKFKKMINKRIMSLSERRHEIASVLYECSPPLNPIDDWKKVTPAKTLYIAGSLDKKYSFIGRQWEKSGGVNKYVEISNAGHALLVEQPREISSALVGFLKDARIANTLETSKEISDEDANVVNDVKTDDAEKLDPAPRIQIGVMDFESFSITVGSNNAGIRGIGWGSSAHIENELKSRSGFIISIASADGMAVGVGEVSPLNGLHKESAEEAAHQLNAVKKFLSCDNSEERPSFLAREILSMNGSLSRLVQSILISSGIDDSSLAASVKSGIEMAILAIASQAQGSPLPQALAAHYWSKGVPISSSSFGLLPVNGLITRGEYANSSPEHSSAAAKEITFTSLKIKVAGRCSPKDDALSLVRWIEPLNGPRKLNLRADANRAWDLPSALEFVEEAKNANSSIPSILEFIEEPLKKQAVDKKWSIVDQVIALDNFWTIGEIHYALDESLADLAEDCDYNFREIAADLRRLFGDRVNRPHGCAAFVLKPALIGLELSLQLAKLAHEEFQISAVFSSSFDSGVGLAFTSILAAVSDCAPFSSNVKKYAHGVGTFEMLGGDTLSPSFESYVSKEGLVNVNSLSRALYGLSLDEISDRLPVLDPALITRESTISPNESDEYLAKTSTSTSGRDIAVSVSLPLPFSDVIASSRFTDLPQMSRWSPWLNSVTYLDSAGLTEWNLNVRGVKFSWRARSEVLENPKGIKWESISGLKNRGFVEFEPTSDDSCLMKLEMSIIMPYVLVSLFQGMPSVVQEFVQNKLLKWSLEMFRDAVKADLALERGDIELGDALFGAVEGRANALEEALK